MLDEIDDPNRHQWLSVCRLLMHHHPLTGVDVADWFDSGSPFQPGWNRRCSPLKDRDTFLFFDPKTLSGETRFQQPVGEVIHDARPFPELTGTELWRIANHLAAASGETNRLAVIERSAFVGRESLKNAGLNRVQELLSQLSSRGNDWFRWAPHEVVAAYLRFEVPGVVASVCLAQVLHATIEFLCGQAGEADSAPRIRAATVSHLADAAYRLLRRRRSANVTGFYQLSYLSSLYSFATASLADGLPEKLDPHQRVALERLLLNTEEKSCDLVNAGPFALPARFSTVGILKHLVGYCHRTGNTMPEAVRVHNLHPALGTVFDTEMQTFHVTNDPSVGDRIIHVRLAERESLEGVQKRVHDRYLAEAGRADSVDMAAAIEGEFSPLPDRMRPLLLPLFDREQIRETIRSWNWP